MPTGDELVEIGHPSSGDARALVTMRQFEQVWEPLGWVITGVPEDPETPEAGYLLRSELAAASGVAPLDASLKLPEEHLPDTVATVEYVDEVADEPRPPEAASVTLSSLAPSVRAQLLAPADLLAVRSLAVPVEGVDPANPTVADDLTVVTATTDADAVLTVTGTVTAADAGVPAVVRLLEGGVVIAERSVRAPWDAEQLDFTMHAYRPGPLSVGSVGYLELDGGYAWTADDPSFHADDYRLRWLVEPDSWLGAPGVYRTLFAQYVDPDRHGVVVRLDEAGDLFVQLSITGTALVPVPLGLPLPVGPLWVEQGRRAATGDTWASISQDGITWARMSSAVVEAESAVHASNGALMLGAFKRTPPAAGGDSPLTGKLYAFELAVATAGGAWETVADPDFRTARTAGPLTDSLGNVWRAVE